MTRFADGAFGKDGMNRGEYSRFFYYAGYQGKSYSHSYNKKGLMRNDDPGNLIYAATGAQLMLFWIDPKGSKSLLIDAAHAYSVGDTNKGTINRIMSGLKKVDEAKPRFIEMMDNALQDMENRQMSDIVEEFIELEAKNGLKFDDAHDISVINWGYDMLVDPELKRRYSFDLFNKGLNVLKQKEE